MQDCLKLMRGRNSETPENTVGRGLWWRTRHASCGVRLRRSTTSDGAVNTTALVTTAAVLRLRWTLCADLAACWNTRQKPAPGRRTGWLHPQALAGSDVSMADGFVRCGKAPTDTGRRRPLGCTTAAMSRRCNCDGSVRPERTKSDTTTSEENQRTSRRWGNAKRMRRPLNFVTRLSLWRDTRRGCLL
jgi:hypothetical protein